MLMKFKSDDEESKENKEPAEHRMEKSVFLVRTSLAASPPLHHLHQSAPSSSCASRGRRPPPPLSPHHCCRPDVLRWSLCLQGQRVSERTTKSRGFSQHTSKNWPLCSSSSSSSSSRTLLLFVDVFLWDLTNKVSISRLKSDHQSVNKWKESNDGLSSHWMQRLMSLMLWSRFLMMLVLHCVFLCLWRHDVSRTQSNQCMDYEPGGLLPRFCLP